MGLWRWGCARGCLQAEQSRRRGGLRPALLTRGSQARQQDCGRRKKGASAGGAERGGGDLELRGERAERDSRYLVPVRQLARLGQ